MSRRKAPTVVIGRRAEIDELDRLLDRAAARTGGVLVLVGAGGSGRTTLLEAAVRRARRRSFEVLAVATGGARQRHWAWVQLLRDAAAPDELVGRMLADPGPLDLDAAVVALCAGHRRLVVIDDVERGGPETLELLTVLAGRVAAGPVAVVATSGASLGVGGELWLGPLSPEEIGAATGENRPDVRHALWAAARGLPGPAKSLAAQLTPAPAAAAAPAPAAPAAPPDPAAPAGTAPAPADPVVQLALRAESSEGFLGIDAGLVGLLESALDRSPDERIRARLLARLAAALLGDAGAAGRRRALADEALDLARDSADPAVLAEVLDARLHALWDPAGAQDRLATAAEIAELARACADLARQRSGLFWRFVALMELGRVGEAESALAAFDREVRAAGDAAAGVMVVARHAMLATLRGRFDDARRLIEQVSEQGSRLGLADTKALTGTLRGAMALLCGDPPPGEGDAEELRAAARRLPGHFYEATAARVLLAAGHPKRADLELDRTLPVVLAGSGPRWLGAAADLAAVAAATGNTGAAQALYPALAGYRGRLVVWAGANTTTGPVAHYLGLLAAQLGRLDDAVDLLAEALALAEQTGALPWQALTLAARADVLTSRERAGDAERSSQDRQRALAIAGRLGMAGLVASVSPPADEWTLRRDGTDWLLTAGAERARLRDSHGLHYLRALLAAPSREVTSLDLAAGGAGLRSGRAEPVLDDAARDAYRRRLAVLGTELDAADQAGDSARADRAAAERRAVLDELRRASGLGGRPRQLAAADERARVNVTRALRAAVGRIEAAAPKAGAHLTASLRTGRACRYEPAPGGPARWHV